MRRRSLLVAFGAGALAVPLGLFAQQPPKVARIGFLGSALASSFAKQVEALRAGLRDLGYVEGRNMLIEFRWAEGKYERLPELAAELVNLKIDVLVTHGIPGTRAAKLTTSKIPIVMAIAGDAVATGLVASLARPGGNITGSSYFLPQLNAKRLELLKEALPHVTQVAALFNPSNPISSPNIQAMGLAAKALKLELQQFKVPGPKEFEMAFSAMAKKRVDAVAITEDGEFAAYAKGIADAALRQRLPSTGSKEFAEAGGLIGYGVNLLDIFRRGAYFVDRILKGAKPGELPVEQATKFELVVNLKTAKALGLAISKELLFRADKVIE